MVPSNSRSSLRSRPKRARVVLSLLFLACIGGFIYFHFSELNILGRALRTGRWYWLLIAATCVGLYYLNQTFYFSRAFRSTGTIIPTSSVLSVLLAAQTLSVIMPSEILADQSMFYLRARKFGQPAPQVMLGVSLAEMAELISFLAVLLVGLLLLVFYGPVQPYEISAVYVLLLLCLVLGTVAIFLFWKPGNLARVLSSTQSLWNRFSRKTIPSWQLPGDWVEQVRKKLHDGLKMARRNPKNLVYLLFLALTGHLIRILCLLAVFQVYGVSIAIWKVMTAYAIGTLVWIVSPIPGGIGLVEGTYSLVFVSLGIAPAVAATLALTYRGFSFWLPFGIGIVAVRLLQRSNQQS